MGLKIERESESSQRILHFKGDIDEEADFSRVDMSGCDLIVFDLQNIGIINSCGIRNWAKWVRTLPSDLLVVFENCPRAFIDQANIFDGFFPPRAIVRSFFVPYFCANCEKTSNVLVDVGQHVKGSQIEIPEFTICETCQAQTEPDIIESIYFNFLRKVPGESPHL